MKGLVHVCVCACVCFVQNVYKIVLKKKQAENTHIIYYKAYK